jgi:hypothetical protein
MLSALGASWSGCVLRDWTQKPLKVGEVFFLIKLTPFHISNRAINYEMVLTLSKKKPLQPSGAFVFSLLTRCIMKSTVYSANPIHFWFLWGCGYLSFISAAMRKVVCDLLDQNHFSPVCSVEHGSYNEKDDVDLILSHGERKSTVYSANPIHFWFLWGCGYLSFISAAMRKVIRSPCDKIRITSLQFAAWNMDPTTKKTTLILSYHTENVLLSA